MSLMNLKGRLRKGFDAVSDRVMPLRPEAVVPTMVAEAGKPNGGDLAKLAAQYPTKLGEAMNSIITDNGSIEAFRALAERAKETYTGRSGNQILNDAYLANRAEMFAALLKRGFGDQEYKNDRLYHSIITGDGNSGMMKTLVENGAQLDQVKKRLEADMKDPSKNLKGYEAGIAQRLASLADKGAPKQGAGNGPSS